MDDLQSEKEQIEEMRAWWAEYGKFIIAGVAIAIAGLIGFNQYSAKQLATQVEASERYESLVLHVVDGDVDSAEFVVDDLVANYSDTIYAAQSRLALARLYMDQNRDQDAADTLQALLAMDADEGLENIGRLRLAGVLLYQEKPEEVVELLEDSDAPAFSALTNETLGDAYTALGEYDKAADAYGRALADPSPTPTINQALVQMKLTDLPQNNAVAADVAEPEPISESETAAEPEAADAVTDEPAETVDDAMAEDGASE